MSRHKAIHRTAAAVPIMAALVFGLLGAAPLEPAHDPALEPAPRAGVELAVAEARAALSDATSTIGAASVAVTAARVELSASDGKVLDQAVRDELQGAIATAEEHIAAAQQSYLASQEALIGASSVALTHAELPLQLEGIRELGIVPTTQLQADVEVLNSAVETVKQAVVDWQAEQERLAAEQAAREAAAREAAARAATQSSGSSRPAASGAETHLGTSGAIEVYVRGWVDVPDASALPRAQAAIDAGGQVAVNYQQVGVVVVSAHNFSDSTALRLRFGDTVQLSGALGGTYRVVSDTWVGYNSSAASLLSLGTSVAMQTCGSSSMRVVGLSRIG